jgi:hypothetical protein
MARPLLVIPGSGTNSAVGERSPDPVEVAWRRLLRRLAPFRSRTGAAEGALGFLRALTIGWTAIVAAPSTAHTLSPQECFEGGDFIAHAAEARDNGVTKAAFIDRLVSDVYLIQAFPRELRWFVLDPEDAEFLQSEALRVFDRPRPPETHRAEFLSRCFDR